MADVKRTFLQGKMNKDVDERLVPDGQYIDALNVQVAKSEGSDVGAIENSLGNEQKTFHQLTNAACIGKYTDDSNQLIYYWVTADEKDFVAEYDDNSESSVMLLESLRVDGKTKLNFKKDKLITGVAKIKSGTIEDDLLAWTDDNEQPRCINIERAKSYGIDGFEEDDISLIKKPPIYAPQLELTYSKAGESSNINNKFLSFAYAYSYLDGEMSALSPFTTAAFSPNDFKLDYQTFENEGMNNIFSAVDLNFNTGSKRVTDIILVFKESNSETPYVIETLNKKDESWKDDEVRSFKFSNNKIYRVLDQNELYRLYDAVPRQAKAMDLIGNRICFGNYLEGYDLIDLFGERLKPDFNLSLFTKDLTGKILSKELLTLNVENDLITINLDDVSLNKSTRLSFNIELSEKDGGTGNYSGTFDFILNENFEDAADLAQSNDFNNFIQEVLTGDFLSNYSSTSPADSELKDSPPFSIDSYTPNAITIKAPSLIYQIDNTPGDSTDHDFTTQINRWGFNDSSGFAFRESAIDSSCKSNRSYEAAILYLDEYGRSTTAITCPNNTLFVPIRNSIYQNRIRINVNHKPPAWAKYFRFGIKENKKEYQTIYASVFFEEGLFRWIKLDGANKDKVNEGDTLIVKSDLSGPVDEVVKVRVLEIKTQTENFLSENKSADDKDIVEPAGIYMKIKIGAYDMNYQGDTFKSFPDYDSDKKNNPTVNLGPFGEKNSDGVYEDFEMKAGSMVSMFVRSWETDVEHLYEEEKVVSQNYPNIQDWFEAEVKGFSGKVREYEFYRDQEGKLFLRIVSIEDGAFFQVSRMKAEFNIRFTEGIVVFESEPDDALSDIFYEGSQTFRVIEGAYHEGNIQNQTIEENAVIELDFFNCYALGNGIESYRFKDALNAKYLSIDSRPTAKSESEYREIRRYADLTYSQPYVESTGLNGLNNFNQALSIYKDDVVKKYGSIQKVLARNTDLILFQEDKVSRVLYGKELIVGSDGGSNVAAVDRVLGTQIMYSGEHGISRNPESIASAGSVIWWTDEKRNQVCRLSLDGITVISDYGMNSFFRNMFSQSMNKAKLGAFDPYNQKYVLASTKQNIYMPDIKLDCSQSISKKDYSGQLALKVDFGLYTGEAGVSIITDKEIAVKLVWNSETYSLITSGNDNIIFNKTGILPRTAEIFVTAENDNTNFTISGNCIVVEELTVISVIRGNKRDSGTILTNRYKWIAENYSAPYKSFREEFSEEGGIILWNDQTGKEGLNSIPKTGSKVIIESFQGFGDSGSFGKDDMLGYLISNQLYSENQSDEVIELAEMVSPEPETTQGGEVINKFSFDYLRPNLEKYLYLIWDYSSLSININTHIFIYFDSSGSMDTTLAPLQEMRDTILKDALLPLYENDETAYNEKVNVISHSTERTLHMLNFLNEQPPEGNVIVLVFQDEANNIYHGGTGWTIDDNRTSQYDADISQLRSRLNSFASNYYRGVIFQVQTPDTNDWMNNFQNLIPSIQLGAGSYSGTNGLSDREEFNYKYEVTPGSTPEYYKDQITNALRELGYEL